MSTGISVNVDSSKLSQIALSGILDILNAKADQETIRAALSVFAQTARTPNTMISNNYVRMCDPSSTDSDEHMRPTGGIRLPNNGMDIHFNSNTQDGEPLNTVNHNGEDVDISDNDKDLDGDESFPDNDEPTVFVNEPSADSDTTAQNFDH